MIVYLAFLLGLTLLNLSQGQQLLSREEHPYFNCGNRSLEYKVVCYFSSWATNRRGDGALEISNIDANLCTHAIYAFAKLGNNRIESRNPWFDFGGPGQLDGYKKFNSLKMKNPSLKTLISIGGGSAGSEQFSLMASDPVNRTAFVDSVAPFLHMHGFDGLDMDWEYPGSNGGRPEDKLNYVALLRELKASLSYPGFLLTAALTKQKSAIDKGYDIPAISKELDFINLMTYNFHGLWRNETGINAPLFASAEASDKEKERTIDFAVNYFLSRGAPKEKLVLGLSLRAISFTLADPQRHGVQARTTGPGIAGPFTRYPGSMGFNEICLNLTQHSWNSVYDRYAKAPYAYKGNQWVTYDDQNSFNSKVDYVIQQGLAGVMYWAIDTDDFRGECYGKKWYLLDTVARRLLK